MEKTLNIIQKLSKVGSVVCKVLFVLFILGSVGSLVGIVSYATALNGPWATQIVQIYGMVDDTTDMRNADVYAELISTFLYCTSQAVLCKLAKRYFDNELQANTPFTLDGSTEARRLGIVIVYVSVGVYILWQIAVAVIQHFTGAECSFDSFDLGGSVTTGVVFILLSLIFKYGAEREMQYAENRTSDEDIRG